MSDPDNLREFMEICEASNRAAVALGQYHAAYRRRLGRAPDGNDEDLLRLESEYEGHQPRLAELKMALRAEAEKGERPC